MSIANGKIWCAGKHIQMLLKFHQVFVRTTDFVEPWVFARRAPQDEEMEESASHHVTVLLSSNDDLVLSISVETLAIDATDVKH